MVFPPWFPVTIWSSQAPAAQPNRTCSSLPWPWGTSWNHCPAYLVPSCQTSTQVASPTNQGPTNGNSVTHRWQVGGTYDMTFPYQIPVIACWLHTPGDEYMVIGLKMIWWFDVCFFWRQKGWIQQLKASSVATEYWDRLQGSVWGYKLASLEIVGFIAF